MYWPKLFQHCGDGKAKQLLLSLSMTSDPGTVDSKFEKMNEDDDQVIAFMDASMTRGIDCYVDSYATVDGVEYTIGSPCDYAVALCYFEGEDEQLVPIELDDPLMDDIFPLAEGIIEDEFGEELVLLRTPQTLTLVGVSFFGFVVTRRLFAISSCVVRLGVEYSAFVARGVNYHTS